LGGAKSYASPTLINHKGRKIILAQTTDNIIGIDPKNGKIIWSYNLIQFHENSQGKGAQTNPPLYYNGEIFVTSGYDHPGIMLKLSEDGESVHQKWKNYAIDTHHGGVVLVDGNLYGSNWQNNANGRWVSVDWQTGKTNWEEEWNNKGGIVYADGMLYLYDEKRGNVALAKPNPEKPEIVSSFQMNDGEGPHWSHPAIYNGMLFIRHGNVLMVYDIKKK
jgi:outer membrane protein assembly factor BamB